MRIKLFVLLVLTAGVGIVGCDDEKTYDSGGAGDESGPWIRVQEGRYEMGNEMLPNASPAHLVYVPEFWMKRTEVTVAEYGKCVDQGACTPPNGEQLSCNWNTREANPNFPVNCVQWQQAATFCAWMGARLPTEAEWEYAARSMGENDVYPWGPESPSCMYAIMTDNNGVAGCGTNRTWPVCSKPDGNTSQGLCDMAGNVQEWMQDHHHLNYNGTPPTDGSAWEDVEGLYRVLRGAAYNGTTPKHFEASFRGNNSPDAVSDSIGFRCAK